MAFEIATAAAGAIRDGHWVLNENDVREPGLLLELSRENLVIWSDALSNWSTSGSPPAAVDASVSAGDLDLSLLEDDNGSGIQYYYVVPSFTGNAVKSVAVAIKEGASTGTPKVILRDTTAGADRLSVDFTFSNGVPTATVNTGSEIGSKEALANGIYVFRFKTTSVTAANAHELRAVPAGGGGSFTGTVYMGGFMAVDGEFCGSLIKTTGSTVTRAVDIASHVMPAAIVDPSTAWTWYGRWDAGMDGDGGTGGAVVFQIGDGAIGSTSEQALRAYWTSGTNLRLQHLNESAADSGNITATVTRGETCEAVIEWLGTGVATLYLWVDGVFINSATLSGITPASAWNDDGTNVNVYYNSRDSGSNAGAMNLRDSAFTEGTVSGTAAQIYNRLTSYVDQS